MAVSMSIWIYGRGKADTIHIDAFGVHLHYNSQTQVAWAVRKSVYRISLSSYYITSRLPGQSIESI